MRHLFLLLSPVVVLAACTPSPVVTIQSGEPATVSSSMPAKEAPQFRTVDFSTVEKSFKFSADIPVGWEVELVPQITAINIYDPHAAGATNLERSQIFIRQFTANQFLTLSTVDISQRTELTVGTHAAVEYEITKKSGVADFPQQPSWRNVTHRVTDIRYAKTNPSLFYVFARSPEVPETAFKAFLDSLHFANDPTKLTPPISRFDERVTKKPFGIHITKDTSPVQPERFAGYHTGTDFEAFPEEGGDQTVGVQAICSGPVLAAREADGYGGVAVQQCELGGETVTVLYGHIAFALSSINVVPGTQLEAGRTFAVLGKGFSDETDGERKHLHLSVHKGPTVVLAGYVQSEKELSAWIDPMTLLR